MGECAAVAVEIFIGLVVIVLLDAHDDAFRTKARIRQPWVSFGEQHQVNDESYRYWS